MNYPKLMYDYGNEDVLGIRIQVTQLEHELYSIKFTQEGSDHFYGLKVDDGKVETSSDEHLRMVIITLEVRAVCNPPPEKLFIITSLVKLPELTK